MSIIKHILIDVLEDPTIYLAKVTNRLSSLCTETIDRVTENNKLLIYDCGKSYVYINVIGERVLLIDITGEESIFEEIIKDLPIDGIIIRLIERGYPEE